MKEKIKQKRAKSITDLQLARRREKDARLSSERAQRDKEQAEYKENPQQFVANLLKQREAVLVGREERIKAEADSHLNNNSRRSLAAKKRMQLLADMAGSGGSVDAIEKNARKDKSSFLREQNFGMNDEDWNVYQEVRTAAASADAASGGAANGNDSEEEREAIARIEQKIALYEPQR